MTASRSRLTAVGLVLLLVSAWLGLLPTAALAASAWYVTPTPNPVSAYGADLRGVSCPSEAQCIAVGDYFTGPGTDTPATLAETWNGVSWSILPTPNPSGAYAAELYSASCFSPSSCMAVGDYRQASNSGLLTLSMKWDGITWSLLATPNPANINNATLASVSCPTSTSCQAVGRYDNVVSGREPLAESWNGSGWSVQSVPLPGLARNSDLFGVSCPAAGSCMAVGWDYVRYPLAEAWNGSSWTVTSTPPALPNMPGQLSSVSCWSATTCTADGSGWATSSPAFADTWNGSTWSLQSIPAVSNAITVVVEGVSCLSASFCAADGFYEPGPPAAYAPSQPYALTWNAFAWSGPEADAAAPSSELQGVSCMSDGSCMAVGQTTPSSGLGISAAELYTARGPAGQSGGNPAGSRADGSPSSSNPPAPRSPVVPSSSIFGGSDTSARTNLSIPLGEHLAGRTEPTPGFATCHRREARPAHKRDGFPAASRRTVQSEFGQRTLARRRGFEPPRGCPY